MPPKAKKRASISIPEEPAAKKIADHLRAHGVSKSMHSAVSEIFEHPCCDLPDPVKKMLLAALPWSVCIAADQRSAAQQNCVRMTEEVADQILAKLRAAAEEEAKQDVAPWQAAIQESERVLADAQEAEKASERRLGGSASEELREKEVELEELAESGDKEATAELEALKLAAAAKQHSEDEKADFSACQTKRAEAETSVTAAIAALAASQEALKSTDGSGEKQKALEDFRDYNIQCFELLRDQTAKKAPAATTQQPIAAAVAALPTSAPAEATPAVETCGMSLLT